MSYLKSTVAPISISTFLFVGIVFQGFAISTAQVDSQWIATDGDWSAETNWDNGVPLGNFNAIISSGGVIVQDIPKLFISGLQLNASAADLALFNDLTLLDSMEWTQSQISGPGQINFLGQGVIEDGQLETSFNNYGHVQMGFPGLDSAGGAVWNNKTGSILEFPASSQFGNFVDPPSGTIVNEIGAKILQGPNSASAILWDVLNNGEIVIGDNQSSQILFIGDFHQLSNGHLVLRHNSIADFFQDVTFSGRITGNGSLLNMGDTGLNVILEPGGGQLGLIQVGGNLKMTDQTRLNYQLGPGLTSDLVQNIGGPVRLNGVVNLQALAGVMPGTYTLLSFNNASGFGDDGIQLGEVPLGFTGSLTVDQPNKLLRLEVLTIDSVFGVEDFKIVRGFYQSGTVGSLSLSDGHRLEIKPGITLSTDEPPVLVEFTSTLATDSPASLAITIESGANTTGLSQLIEFFNFDTGKYELLATNSVAQYDETLTVSGTGDVTRFVEDGTGRIKTRVGYIQNGPSLLYPWTIGIDRLVFAAGS